MQIISRDRTFIHVGVDRHFYVNLFCCENHLNNLIMVGNNPMVKREHITPKRDESTGAKEMSDKRKVEFKPKAFDKQPFKRRSGTGSASGDHPAASNTQNQSQMQSTAGSGGSAAPSPRSQKHESKVSEQDTDNDNNGAPAAEKKFTGRCRLFVGNLPNDTSDEDFRKMFKPFGEFTETYLNTSRGFGFIRMVSMTEL